MVRVTYVPDPSPFPVGEHDGRPILCFGAYLVRLDDFVAFVPHQGFPGTMSELPLNLSDPHVVEVLLERAERARELTAASAR